MRLFFKNKIAATNCTMWDLFEHFRNNNNEKIWKKTFFATKSQKNSSNVSLYTTNGIKFQFFQTSFEFSNFEENFLREKERDNAIYVDGKKKSYFDFYTNSWLLLFEFWDGFLSDFLSICWSTFGAIFQLNQYFWELRSTGKKLKIAFFSRLTFDRLLKTDFYSIFRYRFFQNWFLFDF